MPDIHKANPKARSRMVWAVTIVAALGTYCILWLDSHQSALEQWFEQDPETSLQMLLLAAVVFISIPLTAFALYMWHYGHRIVKGNRFPPADAVVLRDTVVLTDRKARQKGRALQVFGIILFALDGAFMATLVLLVAHFNSILPI